MGKQADPDVIGGTVDVVDSPGDTDLGVMTTKLAQPRLPPGYVPRPHIDALLDAGTQGPLTLVSAGAGWGKTLATAAWATAGPAVGPVAWVSLDATDNHPRAFWSHAVGALRASSAAPPDNPLAQLAPGLGSDEEYLRRLVAGLEQLPEPVVLVLDDFHVVDDPTVMEGLTNLLRMPVRQLRLVVLTRADPTLPLHRFRVAGQLREIRSADLALSVTDAATLVAADGVVLDTADTELLVQRTEGWPVGLRLAAMFLARGEPGHTVADFGAGDHAVVEYLAEEVLAQHPPDAQRFLMRTSVLARVNASLAEDLTGQSGGQQHLEDLVASNSFVVALGSENAWFRYHALLRRMLRHRLSVEAPDDVPDLHRRAAHWFSDHGQPIDALHHAADAEDWALMGRLLVDQALPLTLSVERGALDEALARIPTHRLADSPELCLAAATRLFFAGRTVDMQPHLARAEQQLAARDTELTTGTRIGLLLFATAVSRARGDNATLIASASRALDEVSAHGISLPAARGYRAVALANLGTGLLWSGRLRDAERNLTDGMAEAEGALDATRVNTLAHLSLAAAVSGRLGTAERLASQAIQLMNERGWAPLTQAATAYLALSIVHFQRNDVDDTFAALRAGYATAVLDRSPRCALAVFQIRVDAALGRVDAARGHLARLHRELGDWEPPRLLSRWLRITEAEVDLAAGEPGAALARIRLDRPEDLDSPLVPERILLARAFLDVGDPKSAEVALAPLRDAAVEHHAVVEMWLLTALAADRLREDRRAGAALRHALTAAEPEGVRRPFVAWDPERVGRLLNSARALHPGLRRFIDELVTGGSDTAASAPGGDPDVPLTNRELTVLQYLPTMMTYPEIAAELFLSVNTVKSHIKHLYGKLGVVNRRQAVQRARDLGLLEP